MQAPGNTFGLCQSRRSNKGFGAGLCYRFVMLADPRHPDASDAVAVMEYRHAATHGNDVGIGEKARPFLDSGLERRARPPSDRRRFLALPAAISTLLGPWLSGRSRYNNWPPSSTTAMVASSPCLAACFLQAATIFWTSEVERQSLVRMDDPFILWISRRYSAARTRLVRIA